MAHRCPIIAMRTFPARKSNSSGEKRSDNSPLSKIGGRNRATVRGTYLKHTEKEDIVRKETVNGAMAL
jgi:hypothetical protein